MSRSRRDYIERDEYRRRKARRFAEGFCCLGAVVIIAVILIGSVMLGMLATAPR